MPLDDGCRFDQHHGVEDLRPKSVEPNPQQPIGGEEPRLAGTLPAKDGHLMSQGDEFKFQRAVQDNQNDSDRTENGKEWIRIGYGQL